MHKKVKADYNLMMKPKKKWKEEEKWGIGYGTFSHNMYFLNEELLLRQNSSKFIMPMKR